MERLPLFLSFSAWFLWALTALLFPSRHKLVSQATCLSISFVQLGGAIWASMRIFSGIGGVFWSGTWFSTSTKDIFELKFVVDAGSCVLWLVLSGIAMMFAYFGLIGQHSRSVPRGEAVATPLLGGAALLALSSANFMTYWMGWGLAGFAGFFAIAFSAPNQNERAGASFKYALLGVLPEILFVAGLLGCYANYGTFDYDDINAKAGSGPSWMVMCLIGGSMLRNLQIPFMQCVRYVTASRHSGFPVLFFAHIILAATLFQKISPLLASAQGLEYFAAIPALTAIVAAALSLSEKDEILNIGWLASYICASIYLSGLIGAYQAAQALAVAGALTLFLLAGVLTELSRNSSLSTILVTSAALAFTGFPVMGWGWARYLEYLGLANDYHPSSPSMRFIFLGMKVIADLIMAVSLWGLVRERWSRRKETKASMRWDIGVPLLLMGIASLSIAMGGRIFGGLMGQAEMDFLPRMGWFERLVTSLQANKMNSTMDLIGSDTDMLARVLAICVLILPLMASLLWLFRDAQAVVETRSACERLLRKVGRTRGTQSNLWLWLLRPIGLAMGRMADFIEVRVLDPLFGGAWWRRPARFVRRSFVWMEQYFLDSRLIDGLGNFVVMLGKALHLLQNGQVQFYFAMGFILMGAIVIRFMILGGQ